MKKITLLTILLLLSGCTAVLKNSGYSSEELVKEQDCGNFSFTLDSVVYWKRFDMMGPIIPIFPSWSSSSTFGLSLKGASDVRLNNSYCPQIRIDGLKQELKSFDEQRSRCSYSLDEIDLDKTLKLETDHPSCGVKEIILEEYEKWDYIPPFMVTV